MLCYAVVSSVDSCNFIKLPEIFTQSAIPAHRSNILKQADVDRWPHLKGLKIPDLDVGIELLIGTNFPKSMEPEEHR